MTFKRKVIINAMVILGLISIASYVVDQPNAGPNAYSGLGYMVFMCLGISLEFLGLLVIGIIYTTRRKSADGEIIRSGKVPESRQRAKAYFLAAGLVLLVGVSLCFGGVTVVYG